MEIFGLESIDERREENIRVARCLEGVTNEEFNQADFGSKFIQHNKNWYRLNYLRLFDNLRTILSPNTIYLHRTKLLNIFNSEISNELVPYKDHEQNIPKYNWSFLDVAEKEEFRQKLSKSFKKVFMQWLIRAKRLIVIRSQIAGILEQLTDPYCNFCGKDWGLKCESIGNVEDIFINFLTEKKIICQKGWKATHWQQYFMENGKFRTLCYSCLKEITPKQDSAIDTFTNFNPNPISTLTSDNSLLKPPASIPVKSTHKTKSKVKRSIVSRFREEIE